CYTFGRNNHGQLGLAGVKETSSPRVVSYLSSGASRGAGGVGRHVIKVSASARSTVVITRGVDKGSGLQTVNEVHQWGHGSHVPSRVNFNSGRDAAPTSRWQTHDARVDIVDIAAARCHNIALDRAGMVFTWGFGADNLGLDPRETRTARGPKLVAAMLPENCGGNPISVSASDQHSCVVTDAGDLFTWGTSGEEGGALGHGPNRWQPLAKRVPSLKKVVSVAAAPDHTVVLLQASCPSLPHEASFLDAAASKGVVEYGDRPFDEDEEGDPDSDLDDGDSEGNDHEGGFLAGREWPSDLAASAAAGRCEPLTLKQCCEVKLAKEVDLHNAGAMLAYADALDAPDLLLYCAEYIVRNLDAVLVLGCESTNCCLLEASGVLASSLLCGERARVPTKRVAAAEPVVEDGAGFSVHDEEGVDPEMEATALARADMRAKTPSAKVAARAVRSLKKKIARVREWEAMREKGKDLSADQAFKVNQRARMEAELTSLDSQLERAKLAQAARSSRLEADDSLRSVPLAKSDAPEVERALFQDKDLHPSLDPDLGAAPAGAKAEQWSPQLDLSHDETKSSEKRPMRCEACSIKCANAAMYADHLRGKRHRATILRLEQELQRATKASQPEPHPPRTWATVSVAQDRPVSAAAIPSASRTEAAAPRDATLLDGGKSRRASCPAANPSHSYQSRRDSNQLPRAGEPVTMRQALEDQQRAATMHMGSARKEEPAAAGPGVTFQRTPAKAGSSGASQRLPAPQEASPPAVYSLVDFIAAPGSKKSSRRAEGRDREEQTAGKAGQAWGNEAEQQAEAEASEPGESGVAGAAKAEKPLPTRKSFHEILREEEREKQERDEYGESVWFVSRKPRSTSFETIVQQQRREERAAEEEKLEAMEEEMLGLALEMSKQEAERAAPQPHGRGSRKGRGGKQRKDTERQAGPKQEPRATRTQSRARAKGSSQPRSNVEREPGAAQSKNARRGRAKRAAAGGERRVEQKAEASGSSQVPP
ncbi:unnamed protein product, partial [Scytosiphon promiscuus]